MTFSRSTAAAAEDSTLRQYATLAFGYNLIPFFLKKFDIINPSAIEMINNISLRIADLDDNSSAISFLYHSTFVAIAVETALVSLDLARQATFNEFVFHRLFKARNHYYFLGEETVNLFFHAILVLLTFASTLKEIILISSMFKFTICFLINEIHCYHKNDQIIVGQGK